MNQEVAQGLLHKLGWRADAVADGTEVIEALGRIRYGVILMDCEMPELDGYETTERIRHLEQKRVAPFVWKAPVHIIAMTANAMQGESDLSTATALFDDVRARLPHVQRALDRFVATVPPPSSKL